RTRELTEPGLIVGTATYMSPEQARGEPVDVRSDQFSFGLILYEMLAGAPAFDRGSAVQTMAAILSEECPPLSALNKAVPPPVVWIVERCLAKDREDRYGATFDLYHDLKFLDSKTQAFAAAAPPKATKSYSRSLIIGFVFVCLALAGAGARLVWNLNHTVDFHQYRLSPLATSGVFEGEPAWSPDGKNIAFTGDAGHVREVFVRNLSAYTAAQVTHAPQDCSEPFWSPDGSRIFYLAADESGNTSLWSAGASGGAPQHLRSNVNAASVAPNGTLAYLAPETGEGLSLWVAPDAQSAQGIRYSNPNWSHRSFSKGYLSFSPDGKSIGLWLAAWSGSSEFWVIPYPEGQPRRAFTFEDGIYPFHWMPDSRRILFGGILPQTVGSDLHIVDLSSGRIVAISKTTRQALQPAISPDSKHIAFTVADKDFDLLQLSVTDPKPKGLVTSSLNEFSPAWSPIGSQLGFVTDRTGIPQIWVKSVAEGWERPLVVAKDLGRSWISSFNDLSFSADGQRLAFVASRAGTRSTYLFNYAGGPLVKLITPMYEEHAPSWSPDGNSLAFAMNKNGQWWLATASSSGNSSPSLLRELPSIHDVRWSPTGKVIACNTRDALFLISPDGAQMQTINNAQWITFDWQNDGSRLIGILRHADGSRLLASVEVPSGTLHEIATLDLPSVAEIGRLSISRDGQQIAVAVSKPRGDIWMLEGFPGSENIFKRLRDALMPQENHNL
ncbi:MAG TPA: protein kinase, partial [Bryobacteraceae bacterium]|nr:protein kinase [Bryobacteraceae bacterium]